MSLRIAGRKPIVAVPLAAGPLPTVTVQNIKREQDDRRWAAVGQMVLCLRGLFAGNHSPEVTYLGRPKGLTSWPPPIS
jgi:hypothetical protein